MHWKYYDDWFIMAEILTFQQKKKKEKNIYKSVSYKKFQKRLYDRKGRYILRKLQIS